MRILGKMLIMLTLATAVAACTSTDLDEDVGAPLETDAAERQGNRRRLRIAWLDGDPANLYDGANLDGVRSVAAADGRTAITPFYSFFDPALQLEQCLDVVEARRYDAILIIPVDGTGIRPCVDAARAHHIPVVASDLPIGSDFSTAEPQVPGQAGAVLTPATNWGGALAPLVASQCAGRSPCNVLYLAGSFDIAFDQAALAELGGLSGVEVIADQAFYDRGQAAAITAAVIAAQPDVHVVVGAGDQMAQGAEDALAAAGVPVGSIPIVGAGAGAYGVAAVQAGRWYATFVVLPRDEGVLSADIAIRAARCQPIADRGINPVEARGWPAFFTRDNQHEFVGFSPQWPG